MTCGYTIASTSLSLHFPRPSLFICVLFHDLSFRISDRLIRSVYSFFLSCKAYQDTSRVHRICDTFLRPPDLQSQASTNTRDNKLICQFLDFLTRFLEKINIEENVITICKGVAYCWISRTHSLGEKPRQYHWKGRKERAISSTSFANTTNRHSKEVTSNGRTETKQQDSKTSFRQQKIITTYEIKPPINRTTSSGLRTPFNSSIGRHQAIETTESTIEADEKKHSHNNGSPPRPRLLETLQLRSPPRRRSPSKRKVRTHPLPFSPISVSHSHLLPPPFLSPLHNLQLTPLPSQIKIHLAPHNPPQKTPLLHPHMPNLLDPTPRNNNNLRRRNSDIGENRRVEENTHRWRKRRARGKS